MRVEGDEVRESGCVRVTASERLSKLRLVVQIRLQQRLDWRVGIFWQLLEERRDGRRALRIKIPGGCSRGRSFLCVMGVVWPVGLNVTSRAQAAQRGKKTHGALVPMCWKEKIMYGCVPRLYNLLECQIRSRQSGRAKNLTSHAACIIGQVSADGHFSPAHSCQVHWMDGFLLIRHAAVRLGSIRQ